MGIYNIPIGATGGYGHGPASSHSNTATGGIGNTGKAIGNGLGLYPGSPTEEPCYDPNRPSWLPYWLDTFSEESCQAERLIGKDTMLNFIGYTLIPPPYPQVPSTALTDPNAGNLDKQAADAQLSAWAKWDPFANTPSGADKKNNNGTIILLVLLVVGAIYLSRR